ncbi:TonB-dependent receptor [Parvularcula sp. IMCC14364]|uniref:TonB-dependent receptor n=1 Tax=Parvularcula sp. IMCC14364 TaxID=3067902 RepID=UPI0027417222|nr:TonB-dependent receptor [Parvularcula sp. IMCC14364]
MLKISATVLTTVTTVLSLHVTAFAEMAEAADEIVVTGERRPQALGDVPSGITRINDREIRIQSADHPAELLNTAPGTFIHRGSGQEHLTAIRSPVLTGGAGAGSFLYLENGVPLRSAGFANVNGLFESQLPLATQVEIVRGPGGAFYGANAVHGAINIITPSPDENRQTASISISEFRRKLKGTIARGNRGEGFFAGLYLHEDIGFRTESGADQQGLVLRRVGTNNEWSHDTILTVTNLNQETAGFAQGDDVYKDNRQRRFNPNPEAYRDSKAVRIQSQWQRVGVNGSLSITPYFRWTEMEFLQHFLPSQAIEENGHWSAGFQGAWYRDDNVTLGVDGEYTEGYLTEIQSRPDIFSFVQGVHYDYDITATSLSPFAKVNRSLTENLTLTLAARVDYTRYDYQTNTAADRIGRFIRPPDRADDFLTVSPKASLLHVSRAGSYWVSYAEGARPPQTTDLYRLQLNQSVSEIDPERIRSLEVGWRGDWRDSISGEVTAYFAEKENFLFRDADGFTVTNGETRHVGIEAEVTAQLTENLSVNASGTYAQHTYRFDRPVNSTANAAEAIRSGDDVDSAPRTLGGVRLNWQPTPALFAQTEWVHVGEYFMDASNSREYPGHDIFNMRFEKQSGFFTAFASVRNVLDDRHATRADFAFGNERYFPDEGRTLTVGVRFSN